jgi:hypothetical protein
MAHFIHTSGIASNGMLACCSLFLDGIRSTSELVEGTSCIRPLSVGSVSNGRCEAVLPVRTLRKVAEDALAGRLESPAVFEPLLAKLAIAFCSLCALESFSCAER